MFFEARFQSAQDRDGLLDGRFRHIDLLEAARQRVILLEDAAIFLVGGRAYAFQLPVRQRRLEQIGSIHRAARSRASPYHRVDLVYEQNRICRFVEFLEHSLEALLEIAAVLGARQQRAHIQGVNMRILEDFRHIMFHNAPRKSLGDRGLAHAGFAHQQRVVFAATA